MADAPLLKDFVDRASVEAIATAVATVVDGVDSAAIVARVFDADWQDRALKQRIRHIAVAIRTFLPTDYADALALMRKAGESVEAGSLSVWCFNDFVEEYGVAEPGISLPALEQFTKLASAEFAVRPFIERYPDLMARQMLEWAHSHDADVRRLASEGYRPRLPWGMGLPAVKQDPSSVIRVLAVLYRDESEVVRRSVANNLNDISKDHPQLAVDVLSGWGDGSEATSALTKHALRTLVKQGHPGALALLGFSIGAHAVIADLLVTPQSGVVGESVHVEFSVVSTGTEMQPLLIDYAVVFQNVSGTGSRKVFKGKVVRLDAGESVAMRRKISLRQMTTRRIVPGPHVVEVQVNGVVLASVGFDVAG